MLSSRQSIPGEKLVVRLPGHRLGRQRERHRRLHRQHRRYRAGDTSSGVAATRYSIDGGAATRSGAAPIYFSVGAAAAQLYASPFQVSGDGSHVVSYWAVALSGSESVHQSGFVNIDSKAPKALGKAARVKHGKSVKLKVQASDAAPSSGIRSLVVTIKTTKGKKVTVLTAKGALPNTWTTVSFKAKASMKKGKYFVWITATDVAGNAQAKPTKVALTVK